LLLADDYSNFNDSKEREFMKIRIVTLLAVLTSILSTNLLAKPAFEFSRSFKSSIDRAMSKSSGTDHGAALMAAMAAGSNKEVFFVFPLLFPSQILDAADKAGVCKKELDASIENLEAYQASAEPDSFPDAQSKKIRSDTTNLIQCLMPYYSNGQLAFPQATATSRS
jgi:hypothetical protein